MEITDGRIRPQLHIDVVERLGCGLGGPEMRREARQQRRIFNLEKCKKLLNRALARLVERSVEFVCRWRLEWFRVVNHLPSGR